MASNAPASTSRRGGIDNTGLDNIEDGGRNLALLEVGAPPQIDGLLHVPYAELVRDDAEGVDVDPGIRRSPSGEPRISIEGGVGPPQQRGSSRDVPRSLCASACAMMAPIPKSATLMRPSRVTNRFAGFKSRWIMPCWWAKATARVVIRKTRMTSLMGGGCPPKLASQAVRSPPSTYSYTRKGGSALYAVLQRRTKSSRVLASLRISTTSISR